MPINEKSRIMQNYEEIKRQRIFGLLLLAKANFLRDEQNTLIHPNDTKQAYGYITKSEIIK